MTNQTILVADIGGTNARFGIAEINEYNEIHVDHVEIFATAHFESLSAAALKYLDNHHLPKPNIASISVAGPIVNDQVKLTNCPWNFSKQSLKQDLQIDELALLNDFAAIAAAVPYLNEKNLMPIGANKTQYFDNGPKVIVGPGTGLGVAGLIQGHNDQWQIISSEGGHNCFAPGNELEIDLLKILRSLFTRVSAERLLCGQGLVDIYFALGKLKGDDRRALTPPEITSRALESNDPECLQVLEVFCRILGRFTGDMALTFKATGGVYLGGGILPKIRDFLAKSEFRVTFEAKGRQTFIRDIPTRLIIEPQPALIGAAAFIM